MKREIKYTLRGFVLLMVVFAAACIKPAHEEEFGPVESKSCTDGMLNQGEYFVDCGGPCAPCPLNSYVNFVISGQTWMDPDTNLVNVNSSWDSAIFIDSSKIRILMRQNATAPNLPTTLNFVIDRTWRGVHEIDLSTISGNIDHQYFVGPYFVGTVPLESGVVTITNVDEVNGLISGEFKFNCQPNTSGNRFSILEGVFRDIPTSPPL